jgi:hypothetical protein
MPAKRTTAKTPAAKPAAAKRIAARPASRKPAASTSKPPAPRHRVFAMSFASVYPHYIAKAEKKGRTKAEVDEIILWLTGYTAREFAKHLKDGTDFEAFYGQARLNPARTLITGTVCGVRVETIEDPLMRELRYLDKLIDELAKGREMGRILRKAE